MVAGQKRLHRVKQADIIHREITDNQQHQSLAQPPVRYGSQGKRHVDKLFQPPLFLLYLNFHAPTVYHIVRTPHDRERAVGMQTHHVIRLQIGGAQFRCMNHQRTPSRQRQTYPSKGR